MLRIDLHDLHGGAVDREETVGTPGEVWPDVPGEFRGPVRVRIRAEPIGGGEVHVTGGLAARLALPCRRCLRDAVRDLDVGLDILYRARDEETEDGAGPGTEGGDAEAVFPLQTSASGLDLVPALREELLLAVPPYPLCDPECKGLCPKCGVVLDEEECDCVLVEPDPRWDALRELGTG